jgi:polyketide biosynthesis 3-hydroxy-3-methylglutaryl-CoA synthase-like enzyme PksG
MDTLRPRPDLEAGDTDLSLLSYLECLQKSYQLYRERVDGADIVETFDYLVFHAPFAGMVKGAHRTLLRRHDGLRPDFIERDFETRMSPSLIYCTRVGNMYSAALYVGLCSLIDHVSFDGPKRVGMFSYGSGCASEFYSGVVPPGARAKLAKLQIGGAIDRRRALQMDEYELVSDLAVERMGGVQDQVFDVAPYRTAYDACMAGQGLLVLDRISNFHRRYRWS